MNLHALCLVTLAARGLGGFAAEPQKKPLPPVVQEKPAEAAPLTVVAQVTRTAPCTLTLKGRTEFQTTLKSTKSAEVRSKRIVEDFDYELPGRLTESVYPTGEVEFVFTPVDNPAAAGAKARLHLEDDFPAPGWAPVAVDATRLQNAGKMTFKSLGRGQGIFALGGAVINMKGRLASLAPMTVAKGLGETENRPVASTPFPLMEGNLRKVGLPTITFQGSSLWAWSNTPGPLTLRGVLEYRSFKLPRATVDGRIELTFQIGATEK